MDMNFLAKGQKKNIWTCRWTKNEICSENGNELTSIVLSQKKQLQILLLCLVFDAGEDVRI
jgi:hypothetical protein